jgi:hypothetical protein
VDKARNDLTAAVPKFCLALEEHRRTPDGRVRTSQDLVATFFPYDEKGCTDRLFRYLPNDARGPVIAAWGIRGIKAALRDTDEKVQSVVHDALVAGDVDHIAFEDGLTPELLVRWVPLADLWSFWRGGKLTKQAIHKALATAYELYLFDARWFLDSLQAKGGSLRGTDVLADGLAKEDLSAWVRRIHETADGSPKGIVAALGWEKIVAKTANEVLVGVLDAMVAKVGLVLTTARDSKIPASPGSASEKPPADEAWGSPSLPPVPVPTEGDVLPPRSEEVIQVLIEEELSAASTGVPATEESARSAAAEEPAKPAFRPAAERPPGVRPGQRR